VAADSLESRKDSRPYEPALLDRSDWFRCSACGVPFCAASGLRAHHRFGRCPGTPDPLDEQGLPDIELRRQTRERLRRLAEGGL
jgi:hypothetical protein